MFMNCYCPCTCPIFQWIRNIYCRLSWEISVWHFFLHFMGHGFPSSSLDFLGPFLGLLLRPRSRLLFRWKERWQLWQPFPPTINFHFFSPIWNSTFWSNIGFKNFMLFRLSILQLFPNNEGIKAVNVGIIFLLC